MIVLPVNPPGFQVYVVAPLAVRVMVVPEQSVWLPAEAGVIVGVAYTVTEAVGVFVAGQPAVLCPLRVYCVVESGLSVKPAALRLPGFNVYVEAPDGLNTTLLPEHILAELTERAKVGVVLTVTLSVAVLAAIQALALVPDKV